MVPILEVAFRNDMWWSLPVDLSALLFEQYENNQNAIYIWDWEDDHQNAVFTDIWGDDWDFRPGGEPTTINRYRVNFLTWEQENMDNGRRRSVRLVWTITGSVQPPRWTGEIP